LNTRIFQAQRNRPRTSDAGANPKLGGSLAGPNS
jgi:hypothetical protein